MMVAAATRGGINPTLPSNEGLLFTLFLCVAGLMMLTAAALMVTKDSPRHAVRYCRSRRDPNGQ